MSQYPPQPHHPGPPPQKPLGDPANFGGPLSNDEKQSAMLAHLLGAFTGFLGPLIIWASKKDQSPFVEDQGKEALNFQLSVLLVQLIVYLVATPLSCFTFGLSMVLPLGVAIYALVMSIMASTKASNGQWYRYDLCIRFIK